MCVKQSSEYKRSTQYIIPTRIPAIQLTLNHPIYSCVIIFYSLSHNRNFDEIYDKASKRKKGEANASRECVQIIYIYEWESGWQSWIASNNFLIPFKPLRRMVFKNGSNMCVLCALISSKLKRKKEWKRRHHNTNQIEIEWMNESHYLLYEMSEWKTKAEAVIRTFRQVSRVFTGTANGLDDENFWYNDYQ